MYEIEQLIQKFNGFANWVNSIEEIDDDLFFGAIKEGKWSPAEIISHITYWDRYMVEDLIPKMKIDANIDSLAFHVINEPASKYAMSGVSKQRIINEQVEARNVLIQALNEKSKQEFFAAFKLNGEEIDEYSGYPHSMFNYISSFVWHDNHHKEQIEEYLNENEYHIKGMDQF